MARTPVVVRIDLERIICHDEGDGIGSAEPYLWVAFFKVDGTTVTVNSAFTLDGVATVEFTPGSHGNLPNDDVDPGEVIAIPPAIGEWSTRLEPIGFQDVPDLDVGGAAGAVVVLMEEDNVTDAGAAAGHTAFDSAVREALNEIVATRTVTNQDVSDEELAGFEEQISDAVKDAVANQQGVFANIWSWLNADDTIGFKAFVFSHDSLTPNTVTGFSHRWRNEGDWEVQGTVTALDVCPATALDGILPAPKRTLDRLAALRRFRDGAFAEQPGLAPWFTVLQRNAPAVVRVLTADPDLRSDAASLLDAAVTALDGEPSAFGAREADAASRLARTLAERTRSRRLRIDARRAADALADHRFRRAGSIHDVLAGLAADPPSRRYPGTTTAPPDTTARS